MFIHRRFQSVGVISHILKDAPETAETGWEKVRSSAYAHVYRQTVEAEGQAVTVYVKEYLWRSGFDCLKHLFRPSRAMRSFSAGLMLAANGLRSPDIIAVFEKRRGPVCLRNILITREMTDARALYTFFENNGNFQNVHDRREMITALGRTVGRMHGLGIFHGDLRSGNVFVVKERSGWRFYLIDNERTVQFRHLPFRRRIKNLVQLNMLRKTITDADRLRFFRAYADAAGLDKNRAKYIAAVVIRKTQRRLMKRARGRLGIAGTGYQTHWNFQRAQWCNCRGILANDFSRDAGVSEFIGHIESLMKTGTVLKNDTSTRVVRCTWNGLDIVIKRYNYQGLWHSLRHTIKGSRAKKCWRFGHRLHAAGIATARPLGFLEQRKAGLLRQSFILNEFVEGPQLHAVMNLPGYSEAQRQAVLEKAERLLKAMRDQHLIHADMKPANLLICRHQPVLIDLDSMEHHRVGWFFRYRYDKMRNYFYARLHGKHNKH